MKYLKQGWLVLVLAVAFAAGLAGVQVWLGPIIKKNQVDKTYRNIPKLVLGAAAMEGLTPTPKAPVVELTKDGKIVRTIDVEEMTLGEKDAPITAYKASEGGKLLGYVVEGAGPGYADKIITLVGLSADLKTITGVSVIKQMETPNLGSKIVGPWADQYEGKSTGEPLVVVKDKTGAKDNNKIDAISGATISSDSLTQIVNKTVEQFKAALAKPNATK